MFKHYTWRKHATQRGLGLLRLRSEGVTQRLAHAAKPTSDGSYGSSMCTLAMTSRAISNAAITSRSALMRAFSSRLYRLEMNLRARSCTECCCEGTAGAPIAWEWEATDQAAVGGDYMLRHGFKCDANAARTADIMLSAHSLIWY